MAAYLPDLPPETPDIWTVCDGFHPNGNGEYRSGWFPQNLISSAVGAAGQTAHWCFSYQTVNGDGGILVVNDTATDTEWWVYSGSWADRYPGSGSVTGIGRNHALQVGNTTLLAGGVGMFSRDATTTNNFASVASGPGVSALAVNNLNIVLAAGYSSATWYTSDTNAPTTWSGGEATSGPLNQTPGAFSGIGVLGADFLLFKKRGVYRGQYVGGTQKWIWRLLDPMFGSYGNESVCSANGRVYFAGPAGVYDYDGATFRRLDNPGITRTLRSIIGKGYESNDYNAVATKLIFDSVTRNLFLFAMGDYLSLGSVRNKRANAFFTYNVDSGKWGYQSQLSEDGTVEFNDVFDLSPYLDYAYLGISGGTAPKTNVGFYNADTDKIDSLAKVFNATDVPGTNYKPKIRTSRIGGRNMVVNATRVIPHWTKSDGIGSDLSTATLKNMVAYHSDSPMEAETQGATVTLSTDMYWGDNVKTAKYQSFEFQINAEACIAGYETDAKFAGKR